MRIALVVAISALSAVLYAQDAMSPRESYEAFVDAVLDEDMDGDSRTAAFERYFDFDAWVKRHEDEQGGASTEEERAGLLEEWLQVFRSEEFRERYERGNVTVERELMRDDDEGKAELLISLETDDRLERFRVQLNRSEDGTHWRWYAIPPYDGDADEDPAPADRLAEIEKQLAAIAEKQRDLDELAARLRGEAASIRAEIVEEDAGESPYATPASVVRTAWRAIENGNAESVLACHVEAKRPVKDGAVVERVAALRDRLMAWEVLDTIVDVDDARRATVRVKLTLQRTGTPDERTISVNVRRAGGEWKIDEAP